MCQRKSHYPDFMRKGHSTCHCKISEDSRSGSRFLNQAGSWHGMWLGEALNHPTNLVVGVINDPTSPSPSSISLVDFPISPIHYLWETFTPDSLHLLDTGTSTCNGCQFSVQKNHFAVDNDMEAERPGHSNFFFHLPTGCVCRCKNFCSSCGIGPFYHNRPQKCESGQTFSRYQRPWLFSKRQNAQPGRPSKNLYSICGVRRAQWNSLSRSVCRASLTTVAPGAPSLPRIKYALPFMKWKSLLPLVQHVPQKNKQASISNFRKFYIGHWFLWENK